LFVNFACRIDLEKEAAVKARRSRIKKFETKNFGADFRGWDCGRLQQTEIAILIFNKETANLVPPSMFLALGLARDIIFVTVLDS